MPRIFAWSTASLSARAEVANRLVAKGLKLSLKPITADISQIVTAATAPPPETPTVAPPPAAPAPTVALLGLEGIAATWGAFVDTELFPYVVQTFADAAGDIAGDLTSALGDVIMPVGNAYAEEYLAQAKNRLKGISDLLLQSTRDELVFGMEQGYDMSQMAAAVKQAAGVAEPRAMVIARTEVIGAANAGSIIQMRAAGFEPGTVTKEWLSTHDTRTRPAHEDADGQTVDLDEPFIVGREALDRPLDPNGSPGNIIDCRCAMAFDFVDAPLIAAKEFDESQVKRDKEGKFAKKAGFKLPDFNAMEKLSEVSKAIKSITPEQYHQLSDADKKKLNDAGKDLEAAIFTSDLSVISHIENLQISEPDDTVDTDGTGKDVVSEPSVADLQKADVLATTLTQWLAMTQTEQEELEDVVSDLFMSGNDDDGAAGQHIVGLKIQAEEVVDEEIAAAPVAAPVLGAPKPINIKTVYKDKYADAEIVAIKSDGKTRLVWDEGAKKFLLQKQTDTSAWQTSFELGKGETYNTFKGDTDWFAPGTPSAAPVSTAISAPVPTVTSPIAAPSTGVFPNPANLKSTGKKLGTHGAMVYKDQATGKEWLFKPTPPGKKYTAYVDTATAEIQEKVGLPTPKFTTATVDGKFGSVQEMVPGKPAFPGTFDASKLSKADIRALLQHQVLDWFIGNHDSHKGNFIRDANGQLVGVDKGQAFKFYAGDQLSTDFHINEHESIYAQLWKQYEQGKVDITDEDRAAAFQVMESLQNISKEDLDEILFDYSVGAASAGDLLKKYSNGQLKNDPNLTPNDGESFFQAVDKRLANLQQDFATFYALQKIKKAETTGTTTPVVAPVVTPTVYAPNSPPGPAWGPFKKSTAYDVQYDFGHLAHENNSEFAADKKYTQQTFKISDLHPTQDEDDEEWGGGEGDALPFVITKDGQHYLVDGHHRAVKAGANGELKVWHLNLDEPATPAPTVTTSPAPIASLGGPGDVSAASGPVGLPKIPTGQALTQKSGLTASTSSVDPIYGHVIEKSSDGSLYGYVKQVSGIPPKWVFTNPQGDQSGEFVANYLPKVLENIVFGTDVNGNSTKPINAPGVVPTPNRTGTPISAPTTTTTTTATPKLPTSLTHKKKPINTKTVYKDTYKHNEVVAVNQVGERLLWNESFKKFQHQTQNADGTWKNIGFYGKGEAYKKFKDDTDWFAPNPSDASTGASAPTPTIAPSPITSLFPPTPAISVTPSINVAPASSTVQQQAAQSGIDVPEELLPPVSTDPTDVPPPPSIPVIANLNADYSSLTIDQKQSIGFNAKALPTKTPLENFEGALKASNATPNVNLAQILAYLDAKNVKFGGEPGFYTKQIVEWLRTPDGKKAARQAMIDAAKVKTAPAVLPYQKGIDLKPYTIGVPSTTDTHFPQYTSVQLQNMQNKLAPWTTAQAAGLKKYTGSAYHDMNGYLRTGVGSDATKKSVEDAQKGMRPMPFPILTMRGSGTFFGTAQPTVAELQAMVGVTVRDKGFLSTGKAFSGAYRLEIEVPTGTPAAFVKSISNVPTENELLLAAGLKYQIIEVKSSGYPIVVRMRVVP